MLNSRILWCSAGAFVILATLTLAATVGLFNSSEFLPHATCYLRNGKVILLHVSSDLVIGLSYLTISITLGYLVRKARKDMPFHWIFLAFGLFIITCGFTHLMEVVTVWKPLYWLAGWVKAVTAMASLATAIALILVLPKVFQFIAAAQASERHRAELVEANEELNAFAYSVSHDLRAPLRAVQGMSAALKEDYASSLDPGAVDYLDRVVAASARMDALINDLLQYSRVSRSEIEMLPVEVSEAVRDGLITVSAAIAETRTQVQAEGPEVRVLAHKTLLVQLLSNVLGNAIKFMPAGRQPNIRIRTEDRGGTVRISVIDNGIGIAPEYQEKIFRIFERLHPVSDYPGTGIGLAIVQKAVSRMNGKLGLESSEGQGSTFWVELPKA